MISPVTQYQHPRHPRVFESVVDCSPFPLVLSSSASAAESSRRLQTHTNHSGQNGQESKETVAQDHAYM